MSDVTVIAVHAELSLGISISIYLAFI